MRDSENAGKILDFLVDKKTIKKEDIEKKLEKAKENGDEWKIKQLEATLHRLEKKINPDIAWNSSTEGTYVKDKERENKEITNGNK